MRIYLILLLTVMLACASEPAAEEGADSWGPEDVEMTDTAFVVEEIEDEYVETQRDFGLEEMPTRWIMLSEQDIYWIVLDHWESQGEALEFEAGKGEDWGLSIMYAQDSEGGTISEFEATLTETEMPVVRGSFVWTSDYTEDVRSVNFEWNQIQRLCEFKGIGLGSETFVPEGSEDFFEKVVVEREEDP